MKRPYLSALLIGALTVASVGSLTSCKEYDGDISDLKEQVERAALKTDLETLQATVRNVQTADSIAAANAKKAIETLNAHDLTQMENSIKDNAQKVADAIESTNTQIQNLKKENEKAVEEAAAKINESLKAQMEKWGGALDNYYTAKQINEKLDALAEAVNKATDEQLADLKKTVESYKTNINALYSAVTSVSLYINSEESTETAWQLTFPSGKVAQDYDFGKKEVNNDTIFTATPIVSYKKDTPINLPTKLTVRVNPVNAALTTDMIKLVDSEGNTLDDIIQVKSVEKRSGLLLKTKASQGTGLWDVYFQVKDGVDASKAERKSGSNYIAYAFAVNNTASKVDTTAISSADAASRYVVSAYDLTLRGAGEYSKASSLGDITVATESEPETKKKLSELKPQQSKTELLGVQNGENILLDLSALKNKAEKFYVAVDYSGVVYDSNMSEYNAWKSYQYTNMNKVYDVSEANPTISVTINGQADDEVQFRIFAVNYDGTLVENTGKAFRVKVGAVTNIATVEGDLKAAITSSTTTGTSTYTTSMVTGWLPISQTLMKGAQLPTQLEFTGNDGKSITASVSYAEDAEGKTTFTPSTTNTDNTKVKYVKFTIPASNASTSNLQYWPDGGTLTAYIKDTASPTINKIKVTLKKVMPTAEDAKKLMSYEWKGGYLVNGTYTAYLAPCSSTSSYQAAWTSDLSTTTNAVGYTDMSSVINMDKSVANSFCYISVENANNSETDTKYTAALTFGKGSSWAMPVPLYKNSVASNLIDNKTIHKSSVIFDFGTISSEKKNSTFMSYEVVVDTYNTIFACPLEESVQKFAWEQAIKSQATTTAAAEMMDVNVITFGTTYNEVTAYADSKATSESKISLLKYIKATNSANSNFSLSLYDLLYSSGGSQKYLSSDITAHLYTKGTKNEDFFTVSISGGSSPSITFSPKSSTTQPVSNIESTLEINLKDAFGHTHTYEVPMLVKTK